LRFVQGSGGNLHCHIIGFAGFNVTGYEFKGNGGSIDGSFVHVDWRERHVGHVDVFGATTSHAKSADSKRARRARCARARRRPSAPPDAQVVRSRARAARRSRNCSTWPGSRPTTI
jgi:hypothetical protein